MADGALTAERVEESALRFLDLRQVRMIDDALANLGEFGEIRLVIQKGQLRYLVTQRSYDASKWDGGRVGRTKRRAL
jgi:Holliday junction resolvase-like predicted endonuclease